MLKYIESSDNNKLKLVRKLANRKTRDEENKIVIEGINLVTEAVNHNIEIDFIMISENFDKGEFINQCINDNSILVYQVPTIFFNKLVDAENGVGIIAVIAKPKYNINDIDKISKKGNVLVLDRIQDPGNMGTMIRTAVAAGYEMIVANKGTVDIFSPKVLRSTAGMIFCIPVIYASNTEEFFEILKKLNKKIVVTTVTGGDAYYNESLEEGIALVIGNEGRGISQEVIDLADIRVTIPMRGEIESLNAAVSAAIIMYEAIRK